MKRDPQREELIRSILERSDLAFRELFPMLPKEWLHLNLTMPQLKVALLLFTGGPSRMSAIASELGVTTATATGVADRLVDQGLVLREGHPSDRRVVMCRLSEEGERLISGLWQLSQDQLGQLMRTLDPAQLRLIADALDALVQAGLSDRLLVSHDICVKMQLRRYGGYGYAHLLENVRPMLLRAGITETQIEMMTVHNPARLFPF